MKKMKNVLNKMLAALVITASMTSLCATAYAEEAPAPAEEAYTVTEDEQGAVTIVFNEPIVLSCVESYAGDEAEEDGGVVPYGDDDKEGLWYIKSDYWGTYISDDDIYYITIRGEKNISMRIKYPDYDGEIFCNGDHVSKVYLNDAATKTDNFSVTYSQYTKIREPQNIRVNKEATISGKFSESNRTFTINSIKLYLA